MREGLSSSFWGEETTKDRGEEACGERKGNLDPGKESFDGLCDMGGGS